jgi:ComF family protein
MLRALQNLINRAADLLLPPRKSEQAVRALTIESLTLLASHDGTLPYHEPSVTSLVWELKYRKNAHALSLAGELLAERALGLAEDSLSKPVLVPVPMHISRRKHRGHNQTELLCQVIMKVSGNSFLYEPHALTRVHNTVPQQGLPRHRRLKNMLGAIEATRPELIRGKTCVVVDDVSTTGATVHETKRALLEAGAREVHILTLAHS